MKFNAVILLYKPMIQKALRGVLEKNYSKEYAKNALDLAGDEFDEMLKRSPEIGGTYNPFYTVYIVGLYMTALYKVMKESGVSVVDMEDFAKRALEDMDIAKKVVAREDLTSPAFQVKVLEASKWCHAFEEDYPTNWVFDVKKDGEKGTLSVTFSRCALLEMAKAECVLDFAPVLCQIDKMILSLYGNKVSRSSTLAQNGDKCDFEIGQIK